MNVLVLKSAVSWLVFASFLALGACSKDEGGDDSSGHAVKTGCIQGVIVNGLTGARMDLPSPTAEIGLFALVQGSLNTYTPLTTDPEAAAFKRGEYTLCGIPLDESFPIVGWFEGFAPFESEVIVSSTRAARSANAEYDLVKPMPTKIYNFAMFPSAGTTKDLVVNVYHHGAPLPGATVFLRPTGRNFLDPDSGFTPATNLRTKPLTGLTGADGKVTFAAADIVLGGTYTYSVLPPDGGQNQTAQTATVFTVGLRDATSVDTTEPYVIHVDLDHTVGALARLSTSTDNNDPNASGKLVAYYSREIAIVPGTVDSIIATLSSDVTAELSAEIAGNNKSDSVTVSIVGNVLTLTPIWKTKPDPDTSKEIDLSITYQGLQLRPKASPELISDVEESFTVNFYR